MISWLIKRLAPRLVRVGQGRPADFVIGPVTNPYMCRWYVIPRNKFFNIYLHLILRSDEDLALHDHPWWNVSFLLEGQYLEHTIDAGGVHRRTLRKAGDWKARTARSAHRLELVDDHCITLFVTGPVLRSWGFHCPAGWVPWKKFNTRHEDGTKFGCGEEV